MLKLLSCIKYLGRQGLPFRGHNEDAESFEGNLYQLLLLEARDKGHGFVEESTSPDINKIIAIMGQTVLSCL